MTQAPSRRSSLLGRGVALLAVLAAAAALPAPPLPLRGVRVSLRAATEPSPAPTSSAAPDPGPGGTEVVLDVGPADYVRLAAGGQVTEARTTTGLPPAAMDRVLVVRPDGSTVPATPDQVQQVLATSWAGPFAVDTWVRALP